MIILDHGRVSTIVDALDRMEHKVRELTTALPTLVINDP